MRLCNFVLAACLSVAKAAVIDITARGAVADSADAGLVNARAIADALEVAAPGDVVLIPARSQFYVLGNISAAYKRSITVQIDGVLIAVNTIDKWPTNSNGDYNDFFSIQHSSNVTVTGAGSGLIDGQGIAWWDRFIVPLPKKLSGGRPQLFVMYNCTDLLVERVSFLNSPNFHILLKDVARAEVRAVTVSVSRNTGSIAQERAAALAGTLVAGQFRAMDGLQPEDLNTDGIDFAGRDIWVHDSAVLNNDDSVAVKPCSSDCINSDCTENIVVERMILSGFGASIGSVPPHTPAPGFKYGNCVRNVTFRNISMPKTGKGVYIKSNPSCDDPTKTALIADILYEDMDIIDPRWWAIWIGPQQQHEPGRSLGELCPLDYPISKVCPTQGCVDFRNITLRNIRVTGGELSPGVILGNTSNPIQNLVLDNVVFSKPSTMPFNGFKCDKGSGVQGQVLGGTSPVPACLAS